MVEKETVGKISLGMWGEEEGRERGGRGREVVMNLTVVTDAVLVEVMMGKGNDLTMN